MGLLLLAPAPPSITSEDFYKFGRDALPQWVKERDEFLLSSARVMESVQEGSEYLFSQALITQATGATATTPDWLQQHARDRGTSRQSGESDVALQQRLRTIPDALTRQALLDAANVVLAADGIAGTAALLELPRDSAFAGVFTALSGTGGTFVQASAVSEFTPNALPWPVPPFQDPSVTPAVVWQLVISGAANPANNGTFTIARLDGNATVVLNAAGVSGVDPGVSWKAQRLDVTGNVTDGFHRAYAGRGYRAASSRPARLIMILPYPTGAGTANSVREALRTKKAAGVAVTVERRLNP